MVLTRLFGEIGKDSRSWRYGPRGGRRQETLISALSREDPAGKLWIVQKARIRVYQDRRVD